jgi:hypothetical protein
MNTYQLRNTRIITNETEILYSESLDTRLKEDNAAYTGSELHKVGSISRGVNVGNNQNLSVNSNLDLQISGKLTDNYTLSAALTDQNIPIQPEGTTANVQEFDQVFIQLQGKGNTLSLGDFFVQNNPDDYFFKTFKRSQGLSFQKDVGLASGGQLNVGGSLGVTRGRFSRNTFNGQEGNQGPYRLVGEDGRLFIIIIAGTERVFVNGKLLERGEQGHYTIDYNIGEISFTPNQLITSFDRIVVEFQYADNSFERNLAHTYIGGKKNETTWRLNYYTEWDNQNKPFYTTFTPQDIITLSQAGDNANLAFKLAEDSTNLSEGTIRYRKIDTLANGITYSDIYVQTNSKKTGLYRVTFSPVGQGNGDYRESPSNLNGKIYTWFPPVNGIPQGNFAPIVKLIAPNRTQLLSAQLATNLSKRVQFRTDLALSSFDMNTFSILDQADNKGLASKTTVEYKDSVFSNRYLLEIGLHNELSSKHFMGIERFRSVEFDRTWARELQNGGQISNLGEMLLNGVTLGVSGNRLSMKHVSNMLQAGNTLRGSQHMQQFHVKLGKFNGSMASDLTKTSQQAEGISPLLLGRFSQQTVSLGFDHAGFVALSTATIEQNTYRWQGSDTLLPNSFGLVQYGLSLSLADTLALPISIGITQRINESPVGTYLSPQNRGTDVTTKLHLGKSAKFQLDIHSTYRKLTYLDGRSDSARENTLLNRLEYRLNWAKGAVTSNAYYQISTGRERQYEIVYLFIGKGLGEYVWSDLDNNGKQDLGEFRPQEYQGQGSYARAIVNSNQYVRALGTEYYQAINLQPAAAWHGQKGVKGFAAKLSNQASGTINNKTAHDSPNWQSFNPFALNLESDRLISTSSNLRNSLYFNRMQTNFNLEYTYLQFLNKTLYVYGYEGQKRQEQLLQARLALGASLALFPLYTFGRVTSQSEAFSLKNYQFAFDDRRLKLQWQRDASMRLAVNAQFYTAHEGLGKSASVARSLIGLEAVYSKSLKGLVSMRFDYIQVGFLGEKNTPIGFALLNGLQPGTNYTWGLSANYQVSAQAQIGVNYEGRYSETNNTLHTGSVNARWLF